jgi:hypothetical protein
MLHVKYTCMLIMLFVAKEYVNVLCNQGNICNKSIIECKTFDCKCDLKLIKSVFHFSFFIICAKQYLLMILLVAMEYVCCNYGNMYNGKYKRMQTFLILIGFFIIRFEVGKDDLIPFPHFCIMACVKCQVHYILPVAKVF